MLARACDGEFEAEMLGRPHPGDGHVREAIADEGNFTSFPAAKLFFNGEEIGEDLAGVFVVGEGVDGGDLSKLRELHDVILGEGPDDRSVHHAPEDAGGVLDGFAASELDVVLGEKHGGAAELANTDFKGNACPGGGFRKDEGPSLAR